MTLWQIDLRIRNQPKSRKSNEKEETKKNTSQRPYWPYSENGPTGAHPEEQGLKRTAFGQPA